MKRLLFSLILITLLPSIAYPFGEGPFMPISVWPRDSYCKTVLVNNQGTAGADITVDATAGGVSVLAASTVRCGAVISNTSSNGMRCAPTTLTVTSTVGYYINGGASLQLGTEGQQAWKCIQTGGSAATASVIEARQ